MRHIFLTERTESHQRFYEEGKEAEFFATPEECRDKILYYLSTAPRANALPRRVVRDA